MTTNEGLWASILSVDIVEPNKKLFLSPALCKGDGLKNLSTGIGSILVQTATKLTGETQNYGTELKSPFTDEDYFMTNDTLRKVLQDVVTERNRQDEKFGDQIDNTAERWMTILMEEVGEAAKEVCERNVPLFREEMVQVAAVACAMIECVDRHTAAQA